MSDRFFANAAEANEWLEFDAPGLDGERVCGAEGTKYREWEQWRVASMRCPNTKLEDVTELDLAELI